MESRVAGMASLLGAALASGGALAVSEVEFFDEMPVVLSPSRLSQPLADSPSSVTSHAFGWLLQLPGYGAPVDEASTRIFLAPAWARIRSPDSRIEDSAPPFSLSVLLDHKLDAHWRASAGYYHNGAMTWLGGGSRVGASDRLDARVAYRTRVSGQAAEFWLTGQSLLGGQKEFDKFQEAERRFLVGGRGEW